MSYTFLIEEPKHYDGYRYKVTVHKEGMKYYGGSKQGNFDPDYYGTLITNKIQFEKDVAQYGATIEVLNFGTYNDVLYEERAMLEEVDAKNNPEWYNDSNLSGHQKTGFSKHLNRIHLKILNEEYDVIEEDKEVVHGYRSWQVRLLELITDHVRNILGHLNDSKGKWLEDKEAVVVLVDYDGKEKPLRIGSKHTLEACMKCIHIGAVRVQLVPKKEWKLLSEEEIQTLAMRLNPQIENPRIATTTDEFAHWIANRALTQNIDVAAESNKTELRYQGCTHQAIAGAIKKARQLVRKKLALSPNEIIIQYDKDPWKDKLDAKKSAATTKTSGAITISTGMIKNVLQTLLTAIKENPEKSHWKIFYWHGKLENKDNWDNKFRNTYEDLVKFYMNDVTTSSGEPKRIIRWEPLPFSEEKKL